MRDASFHPGPPLLPGVPHPDCTAVIIVPARDEARDLPDCLDALASQSDEGGQRLPGSSFEILLYLNNCRDHSAQVARLWQESHRDVCLHVIEGRLPADQANAGTARRRLMDTAWHRLAACPLQRCCAIMSTDSDSTVHPQWLTRTMRALRNGADAVGGRIHLREKPMQEMPPAVRMAFQLDQQYQQLVAALEDRLDPQPGDPFPRHLDHFGASLACTPQVYQRAGGLPAVACLEDVAFVDALRRIDARVRHDPAVQVFTSPRLSGRAEVGFANQLRLWHRMVAPDAEHRVLSAEFLQHRFLLLSRLRQLFDTGHDEADGTLPLPARIHEERRRHTFTGQFLAAIDCNALIDESFRGQRESSILAALLDLRAMVALPASTHFPQECAAV